MKTFIARVAVFLAVLGMRTFEGNHETTWQKVYKHRIGVRNAWNVARDAVPKK